MPTAVHATATGTPRAISAISLAMSVCLNLPLLLCSCCFDVICLYLSFSPKGINRLDHFACKPISVTLNQPCGCFWRRAKHYWNVAGLKGAYRSHHSLWLNVGSVLAMNDLFFTSNN